MGSALVTGATGQDGGYLCERLAADGLDVHVLVHDQNAQALDVLRRLVPDVVVHEGDLGTGEGLVSAVRACAPDEVYNLGGISSVAYSWNHPEETAQVSGMGVLRLLQAVSAWAQDADTRPRLLQASSAEIFGMPVTTPQDESTPVRPVSPYGAAKAFAHHTAGVYRGAGLHASTAILYNHESPRRPPAFVTRKITKAVAAIARGAKDPLVLGNLDARRDWGWAPDYVDAMVRIIRAQQPADYVVATGEAHSVAEFVAAAFAHVGIDDWADHVRTDPAFVRPADPAVLAGDATRLRSIGWAPTVPFEEIVGRMVDADLDDLDNQHSLA